MIDTALLEEVSEVVATLEPFLEGNKPACALILGSGLGDFVSCLSDPHFFPYQRFSVFPRRHVDGHAGNIVIGELHSRKILVFQGRFHLYEGYSARQVAFPVRVAAALGCEKILLTNAVGGIREGLGVGDFLYVEDHINFTGENPLVGETDHPFVDLTQLYRTDLFPDLKKIASQADVGLERGVLAALKGPSYETPAEIRALSLWGAAVVSMSMVPESIMAAWCNMEVAGLSLVTNLAAGVTGSPLSHTEVLQTGNKSKNNFIFLVESLLNLWL
jgi:purine-nucleoside phosphorylase